MIPCNVFSPPETAVYLSHQASWLGKGWSAGVCVLVFVSVASRLWILRRTWRAETQSIRAFVELWHRSAGSASAAANFHLRVGWMDLLLRRAHASQLADPKARRDGPSQGLVGTSCDQRVDAASVLVLRGVAPPA
jgi:hypothetical protein